MGLSSFKLIVVQFTDILLENKKQIYKIKQIYDISINTANANS